MQFKSVKNIIKPLITGGHKWQYISISGSVNKPRFYLSDVQWVMLIASCLILLKMDYGIPNDILNTVVAAFAISVSLFMSLLVSIFDKFENTNFKLVERSDRERASLIIKKNFFKRFISITSYLVILSIFIIALCCITYLFNLSDVQINHSMLAKSMKDVDFNYTFKTSAIIIYRIALNYFLLNYLFLTIFITGSAYEYYISEIDKKIIQE